MGVGWGGISGFLKKNKVLVEFIKLVAKKK